MKDDLKLVILVTGLASLLAFIINAGIILGTLANPNTRDYLLFLWCFINSVSVIGSIATGLMVSK